MPPLRAIANNVKLMKNNPKIALETPEETSILNELENLIDKLSDQSEGDLDTPTIDADTLDAELASLLDVISWHRLPLRHFKRIEFVAFFFGLFKFVARML